MLRIVSKCSSPDEFVAIFKRFCDDTSIFIVTKTPKEVGAESRFLITLSGGEPMLSGLGEVVEAFTDNSSPLGRPGMRLHFVELDEDSKTTLDALNKARAAAAHPAAKPPPPPILPRVPAKIPNIPSPSSDAAAKKQSAEAESAALSEAEAMADAEQRAKDAPAETRAAGGSMVLPANPFGDLTEQSLEAFVECTMYEESGMLEALPDVHGPDDDAGVPAWWPKDTDDPTKVDGAPTAAEPPYPIDSPAAAASIGDPTGQVVAGQPQQHAPVVPMQNGTAPAIAQPAQAYAPNAAPPRYEPTELVPLYQPRPGWQKTALVAGIASVLSLGVGYALWGSDDGEDELRAPANKPSKTSKNAPPVKSAANKPRRAAVPAPAPTKDKVPPAKPKTEPKADEPSPVAKVKSASEPTQPPAKAAPDTPPDDEKPVAATTVDSPPDPPANADSDGCKLVVVTKPDGASIIAGGKRLGISPATITAPCGPTKLVLNRVRYRIEKRSLTLSPDKANKVTVRFKRPTHVLRVYSVPAGATAYVNGRRIGRTPASTKVRGYERVRVKLTRRGYSSWSGNVYPSRKSHSVRGKLKRLRRRRR